MTQETHTPTIAIVAEDLLATLLHDWLTPAGYQVVHIHHESVPMVHWQHPAADLLIGELCHPTAARVRQLAHVRVSACRQESPLLMLGPPTTLAITDLPPGTAWMATPVDQTSLLAMVRDLLALAPHVDTGHATTRRGAGSLLQ
ncbi:MAG TPA: hypothetical protein VGE07_10640 [Herpetosiphonaceae bacterium]